MNAMTEVSARVRAERRANWMHFSLNADDHGQRAARPDLPCRRTSDVPIHVLDHVAIGVMAVTVQGRVVFANRAALQACGRASPLRLERDALHAAAPDEAALLARALQLASEGRRSLVTFANATSHLRCVSVVPLNIRASTPQDTTWALAGLILGRPAMCDALSIDGFARQHGMTLAESAVLAALCGGRVPRQIAADRGVAVSTIRTHVMHILGKAGARSVSDLLRVTAMLPPVLPLAI